MRAVGLLILILAVTAGVYAQVAGHDFIVVDDPQYVVFNPHVANGLSLASIGWAFTALDAFNWHPLTWISHMLDVELVGMDPGRQHLVNVAFHLANAALLFGALRRATGREIESLCVVALFALHPMHVESVAWISERKDVLSTLFWILASWAWVAYAERPGPLRYLSSLALFACGVLAKPMVVTFPFALLLLDVWPLGRAPVLRGGERVPGTSRAWLPTETWIRLGLEKVPFLVLSIGASLATLAAQQPGVEHTPEALPLGARIGNALVSYVVYLEKTLWPAGLAALYPHPGWIPPWKVTIAGAIVAAITVLALRAARARPYLLVGWLWFLGTLVPVIGIVQVGDQAMADRYVYVPHVGLFLAIVWGFADLARTRPIPVNVLAAGAGIVLFLLALRTSQQVALWESTETLYRQALEVTEDNYVAHSRLATVLLFDDRVEEAQSHLEEAVAIHPYDAESLTLLGNLASERGDDEEAVSFYERAAASGPWLFEAQLNMGIVLEVRGDARGALAYYRAAERLDPGHPAVQMRLGAVYEQRGAWKRALSHYRRALELEPSLEEAREALARVQPQASAQPPSGSR